MVYILETKLSESDSVQYALKNVYGINKFQSVVFCKKLRLITVLFQGNQILFEGVTNHHASCNGTAKTKYPMKNKSSFMIAHPS